MHQHEHFGCGDGCGLDAGAGAARPRGTLMTVFLLNGGMFLIQAVGGLILGSVALQADSLDFLGDALGTLLALRALRQSPRWRLGAAAVQGVAMGLFGLVILGETLGRLVVAGAPPVAAGVGGFGLLGLGVNFAAAALLFRHRASDLNLRSLWLCLRNDALASLAVVAAGAGIAVTGSAWPDLAVGGGIALLRLHSAGQVLRGVRAAWRGANAAVRGD